MRILKQSVLLLTLSAFVMSCSDDDEATAQVNAGTISGGPFSFVVDGTADFVSDVSTDGTASGTNESWIVTDDQNNILGLPGTVAMLEEVDFDGAGVGRCFIWYIRYEDDLTGLAAGESTDNLQGTFDLSNAITVDRLAPEGATLSGGPFNFIVDGTADNIPEGGISIDNPGATLEATGWVVTDLDGNILGLPPMFTAPDFDAAGSGICQVWHIAYNNGLTGLEQGGNVANLEGVFALSNPIDVNRLDAPTLSGGPFTFTVGDGVADNIPEDGIMVEGGFSVNDQSSWVITDDMGNILGLPGMFTGPDFDGAGVGLCLVWYITYGEGLTGLAEGNNVDDLTGDVYELSNAIEVNRIEE